jgi:hypothetical protein
MNEFDLPVTRYAVSNEVNIAYQVMGSGPIVIVIVPGSFSHIEFLHELPAIPASCASFRRLPASLPSTSEGGACQTVCRMSAHSNSGWTNADPMARTSTLALSELSWMNSWRGSTVSACRWPPFNGVLDGRHNWTVK